MDGERLERGWGELQAEVGRELSGWRAANRQATLAEIERTVAEAMRRLQARYLDDLVHASAAADLEAAPAEERPRCPGCGGALEPRCPGCGGALEPRGRDVRRVLVARQAAPLELRRSYAVCSACGAGLSPPG
jgi:uncharacterized protein with PIN domain